MNRLSFAALGIVSAAPLLLFGCANLASVASTDSISVPLAGSLRGGQQPVVGARVYLMAASNAGYGKPSTSLLTMGAGADASGRFYVLSDGNGMFSVTGRYVCVANSEVYALALGGAASPTTPANPAISMMAALGKCPSSGTFLPSSFVQINEVTTVAAAYALSGYLTGPASLSYPATALASTGLDNAFATAASLASIGSGAANATVGSNGTAPAAKVNTLADIVAACINSTGSGSSACSTLFNNAAGTATPTETISALLNIVHAPGANVAALYNLVTPGAPFQPTLSAAPNDLALTIQYTSPRLNVPQNIRADAAGNIWFRDDGGTYVVEKLSPTGAVLSGSAGYNIGGQNAGDSVALDAQGNAFVGNKQSFAVYKLASDGTMLSSGGGYAGSCTNPNAKILAVAIDGNGNAWGSGAGGCALKVTSTGTVLSGANGYPSTADDSISLALDSTNTAWIAGSYGNNVRRVSNGGQIVGDYGSTVSGPTGVAIDSGNTAYIANHFYDSVTHLLASGSFTMLTGGGLHAPYDVSIDGSNAVWVANNTPTLSAFSSTGTALSGTGGYVAAGAGNVRSIAIDGSGNVWAAVDGPDAIVEFVGVATPAARPILPGQLGARP